MPRNLLVLMRTLFLMESTVRTLDPDFNLMEGLLGKGSASVKEAKASDVKDDGMTRLKYEMAIALQQIPEHLGSLLHKARAGQLGIEINHRGLENLETHIEHASSRMALSLVALGLYIAASLLMQHSIGPQLFDFPVLAALGYGLAGWLTVRVVRGTGNK
jgi:ubiquinone biosynthesis protein